MRIKEFKEKIEVPENVELTVEGMKVTVKGKNGECSKAFRMPRFIFAKDQNAVLISCKDYNVFDKRNFLTVTAHVKNLVKGAQEGYIYLLKICSSHFPMNVSIANNKLVVKNMLGEKVPREMLVKEGAKVEIKGDIIEVTGVNIEIVSRVASDIEQLTRITNRDRRIFQDGIYITHKAGKEV